MANKKFSDFTSKTSPSDVSFVVGYDGSDNVRISPSNLLGAYLPINLADDQMDECDDWAANGECSLNPK